MNVIAPSPRPLVIACIEDHPKTVILMRIARRRAQERGASWCVVYVETPADLQGEAGSRERMLRLLTLAEQMGGETAHIEAETAEKGLAQFFQKEAARIALVMVGRIEPEGRFSWWRTMPWMRTVRLASRYAQVEVVPFSGQAYHRTLAEKWHLRALRPQYFFFSLLAVLIAYLGALTLQAILPPALFRVNEHNIALLFMIACAFAAGRYGLVPGLVASGASFLALNYYFTVPYYMIKLGTVTDSLNMGLFLCASVLISLFSSQTREFAQRAAQREISTQALFTLYRIAADAFSREQALEKLQQRLEHMLEVDVAFFLPQVMYPSQIDPVFPPGLKLEEADRKALDACWSEMKTTGLASPSYPGTAWRFEPMISSGGETGVIGIRPRDGARLDPWFGRLLTAIADQTATVLEHIGLERSMEETRLREEREKLRSMLLSSISHDFKTPLAGIIGALSVYRSLGDRLNPQKRAELIDSAIEEAQRLDSFITNILDMTRLESGTITFRREWHDMASLIGGVTRRLKQRCRQHALLVHPIPPNLEAYMDVVMTEQVLQNLIDNACKYTSPGSKIEIRCSVDESRGVVCEVRDSGNGLPPDKLERIFDKYARLHKKDTQVAGTGLGLAISKAIMEAQDGNIIAGNHPQGGAIFTFTLPKWRYSQPRNLQATHDAPVEQIHRRH